MISLRASRLLVACIPGQTICVSVARVDVGLPVVVQELQELPLFQTGVERQQEPSLFRPLVRPAVAAHVQVTASGRAHTGSVAVFSACGGDEGSTLAASSLGSVRGPAGAACPGAASCSNTATFST